MTQEVLERRNEMDKPEIKYVDPADVKVRFSEADKREIQQQADKFWEQFEKEFGTTEGAKVGFIGIRANPPQEGHGAFVEMAKRVVAYDGVLVIGIGSANDDIHDEIGSPRDVNNPFDAADREYLLRDMLTQQDIMDDRVRFIHLDDFYHRKDITNSDERWVAQVNTKVKELGLSPIDLVIDNTDTKWVSGLFPGLRTIEPLLYKRDIYSGTNKRKALRQNPQPDGCPPILAPNGPHKLRR